jgi:hypothetical protein
MSQCYKPVITKDWDTTSDNDSTDLITISQKIDWPVVKKPTR